jgi:hypothetical protein
MGFTARTSVMAKSTVTKKKSIKPKKKMGRPETQVEWIGIGVRFTAPEKERLRKVSADFTLSQAEFIRRGALALLDRVEQTGTLELKSLA